LGEYVRGYHYTEPLPIEAAPHPFAVSVFPLLGFFVRERCLAFEYSLGQARLLPRAIAVGPCDHRVADVLNTGQFTHFTVVFQPTGFFRLFGVSPWEVRNFAYDCEDVLGDRIAGLHARLCEAATPEEMVVAVEDVLHRACATASPRSPMESAATVFLRSKGRADLLEVADSLGLSDSSCRRHFSSEIGVTPKRYLRMLRFRHAIALKRRAAEKSWTQICLEAGYYDQAHFISECQALVGSCPSRFMRELDALPKAMAAAWFGRGATATRDRAWTAVARVARVRYGSF
jgi:AraC-like DNA-binding protein